MRNAKAELKDKVYKANRVKALRRDGYKCRICGSTEKLHAHHVKPRCLGVDHSLRNLVTLCADCHTQVHRMRPDKVWAWGKVAFAATMT